MPRLPVEQEVLPPVGANSRKAKFRGRRAVFKVLVSAAFLALAGWLAGVAQAPDTGPVARLLLWVIVVLLPVHLVFWQLGGMKLLDRLKAWPRWFKAAIAYAGLASSPLTLYPLGLLAVIVALFSGGAAGPALAVSGLLMLSPILAILGIGLMFALGSRR